MSTNDYIASEVRAAMARKKVTVTELAEAAGVTRRQMYRLLNSEAVFNVEQLERISRKLDVTYATFWPERGDVA